MKERVVLALNLVFALAVPSACGDGVADPGPGSATGGASSNGGTPTGGATGGSATGGAGATGGTSSVIDDILGGRACDPMANTTCQNETSCPDVLSGQGLLIAHSVVETCAALARDYCIEIGVANGTVLSARCESCYADLALCMEAGCGESCGTDAFSTDCVSCRDTQGCTAAFEACAEL